MIIKKMLLSLLIVFVSLVLQALIIKATWVPSISYLRSLNFDPMNIMFIMYGANAVILILLVVGLSSWFGVYKVKDNKNI